MGFSFLNLRRSGRSFLHGRGLEGKNLCPGTNFSKEAFTLVETLVGISFMTVVLTATVGLLLTSMHASQRNVHQLQATYFAQEGIEVMRYFRDSNLLRNYAWAGSPRVSVSGPSFAPDPEKDQVFYLKQVPCAPCFQLSSFPSDGALKNESGFEFERAIEVRAVSEELAKGGEAAEISSVVSWQERGIPREVRVSSILSDWR